MRSGFFSTRAMMLYQSYLIFILCLWGQTLGLVTIGQIITFLTSNEPSGFRFDYVFVGNGNQSGVLVGDFVASCKRIQSLTAHSISIVETLDLMECKRKNVEIFIFSLDQDQDEEQARIFEKVAGTFSRIMASRCSFQALFFIICPKWLDMGSEIPKLLQDINKSFLDLSSDVYLVQESSIGKLSLAEVYQIKIETPLIQQSVLIENQGTLIPHLLRKSGRRDDFHEVEILAAAVINDDFEFETEIRIDELTNEIIFVSGESVDAFRYIRDSVNSREKAVRGTDYAYLAEDGTSLLGMGDQIRQGLVDIAISYSEMVPYRLGKISFLHPTSDERLYVYFRQPASNAFRDIYYHAFSPTLWSVYLASWLVICVAMAGFVWVKTRLLRLHVEQDAALLYEFVVWAVASVAQQGWYRVPKSISLKMASLTGVMTAFILYTAFCGSLVSILSIPVLTITSFQNILDNGFVIYGDRLTISVLSTLKSLEEQGLGRQADEPLLDAHEAVRRITESNAAYISPLYAFYLPLFHAHQLNDSVMCGLVSGLPLPGTSTKAGMFVRAQSPFKEIFNVKILHMIETGIQNRLTRQYKEQESFICLTEDVMERKDPMKFKDIFTAVVIIIMGFMLSGVIFLLENLLRHLLQRLWHRNQRN